MFPLLGCSIQITTAKEQRLQSAEANRPGIQPANGTDCRPPTHSIKGNFTLTAVNAAFITWKDNDSTKKPNPNAATQRQKMPFWTDIEHRRFEKHRKTIQHFSPPN